MKKKLFFFALLFVYSHFIQAQIQLQAINNSSPIIYDINLSWTSATADTVSIEYSTDNGITYTFIDYAVTNVNTQYGYYTVFTENLTNSTSAKIKVTNIHNSSDFAESGPFNLLRAIVTYNAPQTNASYATGQTINVSIGVVSFIPCSMTELYFSADDGNTWQLIASGNAATFANYNWTAPAITSHHCRFGFWNGWNWHYIPSPRFTIINPANPYGDDLVINYPAGGETLHAGDPLTVTWDTTAIANKSIGVVVRSATMPYNNTCMLAMTNSKTGFAVLKVPYQIGTNYQIYIFSFNSGSSGIKSASVPFSINAPYLINGHFLDFIQPTSTYVHPGASITVNWQSYPGLTLVGASRSFPGTNIPAVPVNNSGLFNTGHYTFTAPNQDSVAILVKLEPYIQTPTLLGHTCDAAYFITYYTSLVSSASANYVGADKIQIVPNPTEGIFQISNLEQVKHLSILNLLGKEIVSMDNIDSSLLTIDLNTVEEGIYIIAVQKDEGFYYSKIIKR